MSARSDGSVASFSLVNPWPGIIAVILHMLCSGIVLGMLSPLTVLRFEDWGASPFETGLAAAMGAIAMFIAVPLVNYVPRVPPVTLMIIGCLIGAVSVIAMHWLPYISAWLVLRLVGAIGLSISWLYTESWVNLAVPSEARGRTVALYASCFFIGFAVASILISLTGHRGWPPILITLGITLMSIIPLVAARRYAPPMHALGLGNPALVIKRAPIVAFAALAAGLTESICFGLFILFGLDIAWPEEVALNAYTALLVGGIMLQFPIGWACDRWPKRTVMGFIGVITSVMVLAIFMSRHFPSLGMIFAFIMGGGVLALYSIGLMLLGEVFEGADVIRANAAFLMTYQLGALIGPSVGGAAMTIAGASGFILTMASIGLGISAIMFGFSRMGKQVRTDEPAQ